MLEILEVGSHMDMPDNICCIHTSLNILKSFVQEIGRGEMSSPLDMASLSVFLPHCLFKAAMLCLNDARISGGVDPEFSIQPMKALLSCLGMRWVAASRNPILKLCINYTNSDRTIPGKNRNSTEDLFRILPLGYLSPALVAWGSIYE